VDLVQGGEQLNLNPILLSIAFVHAVIWQKALVSRVLEKLCVGLVSLLKSYRGLVGQVSRGTDTQKPVVSMWLQ